VYEIEQQQEKFSRNRNVQGAKNAQDCNHFVAILRVLYMNDSRSISWWNRTYWWLKKQLVKLDRMLEQDPVKASKWVHEVGLSRKELNDLVKLAGRQSKQLKTACRYRVECDETPWYNGYDLEEARRVYELQVSLGERMVEMFEIRDKSSRRVLKFTPSWMESM
jgi:hypothetical protein